MSGTNRIANPQGFVLNRVDILWNILQRANGGEENMGHSITAYTRQVRKEYLHSKCYRFIYKRKNENICGEMELL